MGKLLPVLFVLCCWHASDAVKKRVVHTTDPDGVLSVTDWVALGEAVLIKSCQFVNIDASGGPEAMAVRLHAHYQSFRAPLPPRRAALGSLTPSSSLSWTFVSSGSTSQPAAPTFDYSFGGHQQTDYDDDEEEDDDTTPFIHVTDASAGSLLPVSVSGIQTSHTTSLENDTATTLTQLGLSLGITPSSSAPPLIDVSSMQRARSRSTLRPLPPPTSSRSCLRGRRPRASTNTVTAAGSVRFNPYVTCSTPDCPPPTNSVTDAVSNPGLSPALVSVLEVMASEFLANRNNGQGTSNPSGQPPVVAPNSDLASAGLVANNIWPSVANVPTQSGSLSAHLTLQNLLTGHSSVVPPPAPPSALPGLLPPTAFPTVPPTVPPPSGAPSLASVVPGLAAGLPAVPSVNNPFQSLVNQRMLPSIPPKFILQIYRGEFVDFKSLYSAIMNGGISKSGFSVEIAQNVNSDNPQFNFVPKPANDAKINSFVSWLRAWNEFMKCFIYFRPHLSEQLMTYQDNIAQYAQDYSISEWLPFDAAFRQYMANNPQLRWDGHYQFLFNRFLLCSRIPSPLTPPAPRSTPRTRGRSTPPLAADLQFLRTIVSVSTVTNSDISSQGAPWLHRTGTLHFGLTHALPPATFVDHLTTVRPAWRTRAHSDTGAPPVMRFTQGMRAHTVPEGDVEGEDAAVAAGVVQSQESRSTIDSHPEVPFCPLPSGVISPISVNMLFYLTRNFPDKTIREYLCHGFSYGFDIGFRGSFHDPEARPRNLLSARNNPKGVFQAIAKEVSRKHTSGPFSSPPFPSTHCSPIGAAPKPDGSVRLILDLSSPRGDSVNDGIDPEDFKCKYSKFDDAVDLVRQIGPHAAMGKIDIKHAFRICPVNPDQWPLLCYCWDNLFYVDTRLPFGSRSSPFIFNTFATVLAWIGINVAHIAFLTHYLDDFFFTNSSPTMCKKDMEEFLAICQALGVPIAEDKLVWPSSVITYLGIEIDTINMTVRLPADKLTKLKKLLADWSSRKKAKKSELLALIGFLAFASKVVKPGRMFLRRLIDLSTTVKSDHHFVSINAEARLDLHWWEEFLPEWNGINVIPSLPVSSDNISLFTDASGLGLGATYGRRWLYADWSKVSWVSPDQTHINTRELFAIWVAVRTWGHHWSDSQIIIHTDNEATVNVWKTGTCKDKKMMRIIRALFFFCAKINLNVMLEFIPGKVNINSDNLSRLQVDRFLQMNPSANRAPTSIPEEVWTI